MILANVHSIRDVMPFPKNAKDLALFEKAPSQIFVKNPKDEKSKNIKKKSIKENTYLYFKLGSIEFYWKNYNKAIEIDEQYYETHNNKEIVLIHLKKYKEALKLFNWLIENNSKDLDAYLNKSYVLIELNRNEEAIISCDQAIKINDKYYQSYNNKGYSLTKLKEYEKAIECFDQAIELNPNDLKSINQINNLKQS